MTPGVASRAAGWVLASAGPLLIACGAAPTPTATPGPAPTLQVDEPPAEVRPVSSEPSVRVAEARWNGDLSTPEALAAAILEVLRTGDAQAADRLLVTGEDAATLCPEAQNQHGEWQQIIEEFDGKLRKRWLESVHRCRKVFDFSGAHIVEVRPKPVEKEGPKDCGALVETIDDIQVAVQSSHGRYSFRIDDALRTPAGWKSTDSLICQTSDE